MTLQEWCAKWNTEPTNIGGPGVNIFTRDMPADPMAAWELFHLSDYVVDACLSGPRYHLCPREVR